MTDTSTEFSDAAERHSKLLGIKLRALVADHLGNEVDAEVQKFPNGAAMVLDGVAWVLAETSLLGAPLSWAIRHDANSLELVVDTDPGPLVRRAERFSYPISLWKADGRSLLRASAEQLPEVPVAAAAHLDLCDVIESAGATVNVEHGVVFGEVRGLEVCRVVDQPTVGLFAELGDVPQAPSDSPEDLEQAIRDRSDRESAGVQLEVGVGANDREAFQMLHGDLPTVEALRGVVEAVERHRSPDAQQHPLNRLAQERYLRWRLEQDPELVGAASVLPAEPPVPRPNLKDAMPCVALADGDGASRIVVCTVGVDLELMPFVADVQATFDEPVLIVAPPRDLLPITRDLAAILETPVEFQAVG